MNGRISYFPRGGDNSALIIADGVTIIGSGTLASPYSSPYQVGDGISIVGSGTLADPFVSVGDGAVADGVTITGNGTGASPLVAKQQVVDNVFLSGEGTVSDPFTLNMPLDYIDFNTSYSGDLHQGGRIHWNDDDATLNIDMAGGNVQLQVGQELFIRAINDQGADILNGQAVYISGSSGSKVKAKLANASAQSAPKTIAIATEDIINGTQGYFTTHGLVRDIDTSFGVAGDEVFLDATDGNLTTAKLSHPNFRIKIGYIARAHATEGVLFVSIQNDNWLKRFQGMSEPTGFDSAQADLRGDISFDDGTLTFTIAPKAGQSYYNYWWYGTEYRKITAETIEITDVEGLHYIYYDEETLSTSANPSDAIVSEVIKSKVIVSIIYWDATNNTAIWFADERHQNQMDGSTHAYLHYTRGAQYLTGLALGDFIVDANASLDAHAQFSYAVGGIADEDLYCSIPAIAATVGAPVLYKLGASGDWRLITESGFSVVADTTASAGVTGRAVYNQYTGGAWQLTTVSNKDFVLMHIIATNNSLNKYLVIMGESEYATKTLARQGAITEINQIITSGLPGPEFIFVGTVIFETDDNFTNAVKSRIVSTLDGGNYVDWRFAELEATASLASHSSLSGLTNDDHVLYLNINGRTGGQTANGGTLTTQTLTLRNNAIDALGVIINADGSLSVNATNYEALVTDDDDIPNKKYIDDEILKSALIWS